MNAVLKTHQSSQPKNLALRLLSFGAVVATLCFVLTGCNSSSANFKNLAPAKTGPAQPDPLILREGDVVRIDFPGAPNLNTRETIRRDGKIMLLKGEMVAAGKTVTELQKDVLDLYSPDLITKVVTVSVEVSSFPIYVTGAVSKSGQIMVDRPLTVLEAVMQAGVDLSKANLKAVRLSRSVNGQIEVYMLNLDRLLKGRETGAKPFYVTPSDIIYVPEKFQWF
jgi:polysaccharide export outer membrane protein